MAQKIHPKSLRLANKCDWLSVAYCNKRDYAKCTHQDRLIREYAFKLLSDFSVGDVIIKRSLKSMVIIVKLVKYAILMRKGKEYLDKLKLYAAKISACEVEIDLVEINKPDLNPFLVANNMARQLERNASYRRVMKKMLSKVLSCNAKGVKIECSGRLAGNAIARSERYLENKMPSRNLRANISYALAEAKTSSGIIGVKVWIYC